jgi:glycosyltransferase involved in cell wall biosynthesis
MRTQDQLTASSAWRSLYKEQHPVDPVTGNDPLASAGWTNWAPQSADRHPELMDIGFACFWEPIPRQTWSGSATGLRDELRLAAHTVDLGVHFPQPTRIALRAIHTHYRGGRFTTNWNNSSLTDEYVRRSLEKSLRLRRNRSGKPLDAVVMIDAIASVPEPFFVYYDSSWDSQISSASSPKRYAEARLLTVSELRRRRDRQLAIFERATGVIAFSHWLARSLVEQSEVPADKVHVVHPGGAVKAGGAGQSRPSRSQEGRRRRKLLFIGRLYTPHDFARKGGDLVVDALRILRRDYDPATTLTMVGFEEWPLPGGPPDGVDVLGVLPRDEVAKLYETHDLFVMPSRMEPFGLVFTEALCRGMPCVARSACAMPEIVTPGVSGALIDRDDASELAEAIVSVLSDDDLYRKCQERAPAMADYFSWSRAARQMLSVISQEVR